MKTGFEIRIQNSLTDEQLKKARSAVNDFIKAVIEHDGSYARAYRTRGGRASYLKRGVLGYTFNNLWENGLTLRRISNKKRIFAVMKLEDLMVNELGVTADKLNECRCPKYHGGGRRVTMLVDGNQFETVCKYGDVGG